MKRNRERKDLISLISSLLCFQLKLPMGKKENERTRVRERECKMKKLFRCRCCYSVWCIKLKGKWKCNGRKAFSLLLIPFKIPSLLCLSLSEHSRHTTKTSLLCDDDILSHSNTEEKCLHSHLSFLSLLLLISLCRFLPLFINKRDEIIQFERQILSYFMEEFTPFCVCSTA